MNPSIQVVDVGDDAEQLAFGICRCPVCLKLFFVLLFGDLPLISNSCDIGAVFGKEALCTFEERERESLNVQ